MLILGPSVKGLYSLKNGLFPFRKRLNYIKVLGVEIRLTPRS